MPLIIEHLSNNLWGRDAFEMTGTTFTTADKVFYGSPESCEWNSILIPNSRSYCFTSWAHKNLMKNE